MTDCIFCKIIAGEIPAYKIYEDDDILAFLDITQTTKGHTLVIPKTHVRNVLDMTEDQARTLFAKLPSIAANITGKLGATGLNMLQNNEAVAGQTVFHAHVHLIPRYSSDDGFKASFTEHTLDLKAIQDSLI
ncbi:MAG: HIT family protein [Lactococcus sp.]|jgi:histidine triad (HIT) family protein|uniref:Histidine triad (HIT) nucleotide-binding protein n=2 Tax=Pseudolactococcus TaxID=3436058 RepID=A0A0D6DYS6_9LACT|nr:MULTISPECIES: HIT family protein [Lactococcus]MCJ1970241.1 HIT family protein [Lactococcus carnosus]MCJ1990214.1 HIT family protein [Lactococcus carnosus]MCJ1996415.1 HIT family protein [Lactococcus carnosus]MCJ2001966.1 HIT family protein [Lactococcus carnosus]MDN5404231.1 HIT family protein [Lactococcus sp.]